VLICLNLTPQSPKYRPPSYLGCRRLDVCQHFHRTHSITHFLSISKSTLANLSPTTSNTYPYYNTPTRYF
jgi:hypothetical protein